MSTCRIGHASRRVAHAAPHGPGCRRVGVSWSTRDGPASAREHVQLRGEREVLGRARRRRARARPGPRWHRARGRAGSRAPGRRRPGRRAPRRARSRRPPAARSSSSWVKRRPAAGAPARVPASSSRARACCEVAGHRPGDHGGVALGDQQAEGAAGAQHLGGSWPARRRGRRRPRARRGRAPRRRCRGRRARAGVDRSPCCPVTSTPALAGAAVERGERVGAGVDDRDPVAELGDPDGEPAGAAADVEDVAGPARRPRTGRRASHTTAVRAAPRRSLGRSLGAAHWLTCATP